MMSNTCSNCGRRKASQKGDHCTHCRPKPAGFAAPGAASAAGRLSAAARPTHRYAAASGATLATEPNGYTDHHVATLQEGTETMSKYSKRQEEIVPDATIYRKCPKCGGRIFYEMLLGKPAAEQYCFCGWYGAEVPFTVKESK